MKSLKKTLVLLVVLSMILSAVSPVFAFSDAIPEEYAEQANKMGAFGVFAGDADGNFKAEENITRAEMAVIIGKLMGLTANEADANKGYASNFSDVAAGDWYTGWVNLVAGRGIISGFPDGTFRPNEKVTQAQAVTMIVKALGWGVVVDQTGTWPANYITKASELRLFKNAAESNGELVTRGNVAIYCYNALTAKTWDVVESTDGSLTSSAKGETILAKYFSDFTNEAGDMKLVEGAEVASTPVNNNDLGTSQIVIKVVTNTEFEGRNDGTYDLVDFLNTNNRPGKNKEEKTYGSGNQVTAYVLPSASTELAGLQGKTVDVIFGRDNEVVYINVVNDAANGLYVTAWDANEMEIELDGTTYEVSTSAKVSLFGSYAITSNVWNTKNAINAVMSELKVGKPNKNVERTLSASVVFDEEDDEKIVAIDFVASEDFTGAVDAYTTDGTKVQLGMEQAIVKTISSKTGKITTIDGSNDTINGKTLEDLEDAKVRVIKNNAIVSLDDIAEGDLLTTIVVDGAVETIFVSDNKVTGTLERVKNEVLTIDGEEYTAVNTVKGSTDGDIEALGNADLANDYLGEEVEAYLNFLGEVVVVLSETEAVPATIGIVTNVYDPKTDEDAEVDYLPVKILTADNSKAVKYYIYHEDDEVDMKANTITDLAIGAVVWFSADADKVIEYSATAKDSDILVVADKTLAVKTAKVELDGEDLDVAKLTFNKVNDDRQEVNETYLFDDDMTTYFNNHVKTGTEDGDIEVIKGWASLVSGNADNEHVLDTVVSVLVYNEDKEVIFYIGDVASYTSTATEYAIVESIDTRKDEDNKTKTYVTLVDGEEYELAASTTAEEGDFVSYTVNNDKITLTLVVDTWTLLDGEITANVAGLNTSVINEAAKKGTYEVKEVDGRRVRYVEFESETREGSLYLAKTAVTVYDLDAGTVEVVKLDELADVIVGRYTFGITADKTENGTDIDTLILF